MSLSFLTTLKYFWPFIQEQVLGGRSFRQWLKANFHSLIWFCLVLAMGYVCLKLITTLAYERKIMAKIQQNALDYQHRFETLTDLEEQHRKDLLSLEQRITQLDQLNQEHLELIQRYQFWLSSNGIALEYQGPGYPKCPNRTVSNPKPPKPSPKTPIEKQIQHLWEKK